MRVFVTGATGFIGSQIVSELINVGHQVVGVARSEEGVRALMAAGAEVHRGNLEDLESLRSGAASADGVFHTTFDHNFSNFVANCEKDRRAIEALGAALAGSNRPLVITSGTGMGNAEPGQPAIEDVFDASHPNPRSASEMASASLSSAGVNVSVVRLPQVHNTIKQGLVTYAVALARERRVGVHGATDQTAGRRPTSPMSLVSTDLRWKQEPGSRTTRWLKRAWPPETSLRPSVAA